MFAVLPHSPFAITYTGKRKNSTLFFSHPPPPYKFYLKFVGNLHFFNPDWLIYCFPCYRKSIPNISLKTGWPIFWRSIISFEDTSLSKLKCCAAAVAKAPDAEWWHHQMNSVGLVTCQVAGLLPATGKPGSPTKPSPTWKAQQFLDSLPWASSEVGVEGQLLLRDPRFSYGFQYLYHKKTWNKWG